MFAIQVFSFVVRCDISNKANIHNLHERILLNKRGTFFCTQ